MDGKITVAPMLLLPYYKEYKLDIEKTKCFPTPLAHFFIAVSLHILQDKDEPWSVCTSAAQYLCTWRYIYIYIFKPDSLPLL